MRITNQTDSELVIQTSHRQKDLVMPLIMLGIAILGFGIMVVRGDVHIPTALVLLLVAAYGGNILYSEQQSETLVLDKTANEIRCDRKTLLGKKHWQFALSSLQNVSVGTFKRRYKKINGNYGTRWSYTIQFVTKDDQKKQLLYNQDGEIADQTCRAINRFLGPLAQTPRAQSTSQRGEVPARMVVTPEYRQWRESMFNVPPSQVDASERNLDQVYGVLMDIGMIDSQTSERWAISMSAFLSGETSFRPTPGGGCMGLEGNPKIAQVAEDIVQLAQTLQPKACPADDRALPEPSLVQFFFLTPGGVYCVADDVEKLQKKPDDALCIMLNQFGVIRQFAEQNIHKQ
ncbi:MAG: hypothetical protein AAF327_06570 [Cyanobacteria bacterium P01_A01_bin.37]